jgi:hypothetical protein
LRGAGTGCCCGAHADEVLLALEYRRAVTEVRRLKRDVVIEELHQRDV